MNPSNRPVRLKLRLDLVSAVVVLLGVAVTVSDGPERTSDGLGLAQGMEVVSGGPDPAITSATAQAATVVGSEACAACHSDQFAQWQGSAHGRAGGDPAEVDLLVPFDGRPLQFQDATVYPVQGDDGAFSFVVERAERDMVIYSVDGVVGGGHMVGGGTQGFITNFPDGTVRFLPFDYSRHGDTWFCNTAFVAGFWVPDSDRGDLATDEGWVPISPDLPLTACGDWPPTRVMGTTPRFANCQNCHGSQVAVELDPGTGGYRTEITSLAINCESCHGPGSVHVARAESGVLATSADLGIMVLDTLDEAASLGACFQCHALKRVVSSAGGSTVDVMANEPDDTAVSGFVAGGPDLSDYSLGLPFVGDQPFHPDGRVATFAYQQNHRASACFLNGEMTCTDCHDPHSQAYRGAFGEELEGRFDDGQCVSCHASKAAEPEAHSFHDAGPDGVRCVNCHMPYIQHGGLGESIPYGRSDHTIPIPRPGFDEALGIVSACGQCHVDRQADVLRSEVEERWGELKPHRPLVIASDDVARGLLLAAEAGDKEGLLKVMAVDRWATEWMEGGGGELSGLLESSEGGALARLTADSDVDVQAVAAAALHASAGSDAAVRALLDGVSGGSGSEPLKRRWSRALLQWAEVFARVGGPPERLRLLRKAQEVAPRDPEILLSLASGLAGNGELEDAAFTYLAVLGSDPGNALALVNVGQVFDVLGRGDEAVVAFTEAARSQPTEALALLNLGNSFFGAGDFSGAISLYEQALAYDPGLGLAQFYLGVSLVNVGNPVRGLRHLKEAQDLRPNDPEVRAVVQQVEEALGRSRDSSESSHEREEG